MSLEDKIIKRMNELNGTVPFTGAPLEEMALRQILEEDDPYYTNIPFAIRMFRLGKNSKCK